MIIQHSANYNALGQTHSNYPFQAYQNSQVDQMNIIGEFPVQNSEDAKYWVATIAFLRTITKMFFGKDKMFKGNPPPILHLSGYGDHMFDKVPVIVQSMNVELRGGIDYISTKQGPLDKTQEEKITEIRNRWSTINSPHFNGDWETALGLNTTKSDEAEPVTWAPTLSLVSCGVIPVYSREIVKHFSLKDFASGKLGKEQGIGFI
jgi:hypothetical protein